MEKLQNKIKEAYHTYYQIKGNSRELRKTFLEDSAEALAAHSNIPKATILKQIREREGQRDTARKIKHLQGKLNRGSTTLVSIETAPGIFEDIMGKKEIEQVIMANNEEKYKQSHRTPFFQFPLMGDFGFKGLTTLAQALLAGVYESNHQIDSYVTELMPHLQMPQNVCERGHNSMTITFEGYRNYWKKAKESTSCYPGPLSFATMKAGAKSDMISTTDCILTRVPIDSGYSPSRWKQAIDVMIPKMAGLTQLNSLQTIVLFRLDCNYAFKHIGHEMMRLAEETKTLAPEQYGSRQNHRAIDLAVNKTLTYDILRQLKRPGAICSNNAKSCYDLIGHTQASIIMQQHGVPKSVVDCLFTTLQDVEHRVRTGYGDSEILYGGPGWVKPFHGIGQGNGAGPAIWAVVSTPLLNLLRSKGFGFTYTSPLSQTTRGFVGYTFVDNTDLLQVLPVNRTSAEAMHKLQQAVDTWEGGLRAACGAIVPEKTFWSLVDFSWSGGQWRYKTIKECPGDLFANDIQGNRKTL